jgi:Uma2 family endonuclease
MVQMLSNPPKTIMEVYKMLPEGTLAELLNGSINMSPAPNVLHQRIVGRLFQKISEKVAKTKMGNVFVSPLDVFLDEEGNVVQPDLIFISKQREAIILDDAIHGSPDIVVEVLSPSTQDRDRLEKKGLYERFGVAEYWIVDPASNEAIGYEIQNGKYAEFFRATGKIKSRIVKGLFKF